MSRKELKGLPKRLEGIAEKIERVNSDDYFDPAATPSHVYLSRGFRRAVQVMIHEKVRIATPAETFAAMSSLPITLKAYARYLHVRTVELGALGKGPGKRGRSDFELKKAVIELITRVTDVTRKPQWATLARLLSPIAGTRDWLQDDRALRSFYKQNEKLLIQ